MKLNCPACGATASLDVLIGNDGAREAVMTALKLPAPIGKLLVQYVALFRPAQRQLSFDRVANILGELLPMIEAGRIERSGRQWPAPLDYWKAALEDMLAKRDRLTLPLKGHGYLLEVIAGMANKAEGAQEAKAEESKQHQSQARGRSEPVRTGRTAMPASIKQTLRNFTGKEETDGQQD